MPLVQSWTNQDIELFHGTIVQYAQDVVESGVDVSRSRPDCDFGRGFYCTTSLKQAKEWALLKAARRSGPPSVVGITVPRQEIAALRFLAFVRGERDAMDFWSLVQFFRGGNAISAGIAISSMFPYDVVFGPVALWRSQQPMPRADQVSFHTPAAQQLLNSLAKRRIISI